jgi:hypothetical protein
MLRRRLWIVGSDWREEKNGLGLIEVKDGYE